MLAGHIRPLRRSFTNIISGAGKMQIECSMSSDGRIQCFRPIRDEEHSNGQLGQTEVVKALQKCVVDYLCLLSCLGKSLDDQLLISPACPVPL
jgi:hypothetical protein